MDKYRKRSMVWSYFKDTDADSVQCLICCEFVRRKDGASTTPMLRHLRLKHPAELPGTGLDLNAESAADHEHDSVEIDGDQIISVVVEMEDEVSNTKTPSDDSDVSRPVSSLPETSQEEPSDDHSVRNSRRRSLIWRLFEHLESLNAARCRICLKKLHESGGVSNLRRHLRKRHPTVLSELLASENQLPAAPSLDTVTQENQQDPVVLVEGDAMVMAVLTAPENPVNGLVEPLQEDSAQMTPAEETLKGSGISVGTGETSWNNTQKWIPVEALQDGNLDISTPSNETEINSAINGILETLQKSSPAGDGEDQSVKKPRRRSLMWQHFKRLESLNMAQCQICMKKLQCFESGCTSNLHRHMSKRHPQVFSKQRQQQHPTPNSNSLKTITLRRHNERMPVEALEDDDADITTPSNDTEINLDLNGILGTSQKGSVQAAPAGDGEDQSVKKPRRQSLIWQHFKRLESLKAVQCQICMKKLQWFEGGCTSNLHQHMSKRHPKVFSKQQQQHPTPNSNSLKTITLRRHDERTPVNTGGPTGLREAEVESRAMKQEKELIEALRRTQREEARTLDQQRDLVERLREASARETAAERENIDLLRKLQQQEAKELSRQREELEKEKVELQRRWEELQREREEILLLSRDKEPS